MLLAPAGPLARLEVVDRTGSTNDDVLAGLREDHDAWPTGSVLLADHQTDGHGRAGRTWVSTPRTSLTGTFVVRTSGDGQGPGGLGWLPLVVGLGVVRALRAHEVAAWLKWPNDVLVVVPGAAVLDGWADLRKVAGILVQATPDRSAVAVGVGLNVTQQAAELPVPTATSLALVGGPTDREALLVTVATELAQVLGRWCAADANLPDEVCGMCTTLGRRVQATLPGGATLVGQALRLADDACLVIADETTEHRIHAGDVVHTVQPPA